MAELIVSAGWLAEHLDDEGVRAVDVRDAWEYDALGHVPGAVNVPFDDFRDGGGVDGEAAEPEDRTGATADDQTGTATDDETAATTDADVGHLPGAAAFAELLGGAGLSRSDALVAYDDTNGVFAARFVVTALVYGFEDVHLLDGDLSAWQQSHPVSDDPVDLPAVDVEPSRVEGADSPLVDAERVRAAIDGDGVLLDTREQWEYEEGHLPGAVRFDWQEAVDPESRGLKPREELEALFAERGITPDRTIVLYCNTARRLSHTYLVLRWLGYEDVGIYEGSLAEWREIGGELVASGE